VTARALFISDLHLAGERPDTNAQFHRFLREEARAFPALYILGDLFEYWLGDDELDEGGGDPLAAEVARALRELSDAGTVVALMHGNRDFLLASRFCAAAGAMLLSDPIVMQVAGERVLLMHGDTLCTDDHDYQRWRAIARSEDWQKEFLARPLAGRREASRALREKSKEVIAAKPAEIMDVNAEAVREAFRRHGVRCLIHGHTHRMARHDVDVDGTRCERWVLPDWYGAGGYLAFDEAGPRLVSF
jgi:UDP-2,3-diacylglucosamine hydrolase